MSSRASRDKDNRKWLSNSERHSLRNECRVRGEVVIARGHQDEYEDEGGSETGDVDKSRKIVEGRRLRGRYN